MIIGYKNEYKELINKYNYDILNELKKKKEIKNKKNKNSIKPIKPLSYKQKIKRKLYLKREK